MTEEERIFRGELFASEEPELVEKKRRAHRLSQKYNETFEDDAEVREAILRELLGELGEGVCMLGPVRFHYGCHTRVGNHCFMNFNFTVQDDALVTIGDHCNFGPNVTIVTPMHPMLPDERRGMVCDDGVERFLCYAKPVTIGHDCWFGANVVVCPGVTIGENCVIGAGSVVTRDIPAGSFAAGNPARVIPPDYGGGYRPRPLPPASGGNKNRGPGQLVQALAVYRKSLFDRLLNFLNPKRVQKVG